MSHLIKKHKDILAQKWDIPIHEQNRTIYHNHCPLYFLYLIRSPLITGTK